MARNTGSVKHVHQYYRRENGIWHCSGIDECTHYVPKNMPEPVGRRSICWGPCGKPFQLSPANMREEKPMCDACSEQTDILGDIVEAMTKGKTKPKFMSTEWMHEITEKSKKDREVKEKNHVEVIEPEDTE